uniref:RNA-directed RNA polymerase n=1 Tax=Hymenopteran tombus-related virus TaxID=2822555 RepID=A0A8A6RH32_9TOMB|nr:RNA-dependent RNA polymerase [Hymenopteran tombus-related virus]
MAASLYVSPSQTPVESTHHITTMHNRLFRNILYHPSIHKPNEFFYYSQSSTTTIAALVHRHAPETLSEYQGSNFSNDKRLNKFKRKLRPWSMDEFINSMDDPSKRKFYTSIKLGLEQGRTVSALITPFTKLEKMSTSKYRPPRLIQARHPSFNMAYGCYIKPLERSLKSDIHFGKGTYDQIGAKISKLARRYKYYTEGDHITFDAHVTPEMLRLCHRFYARCYQQDSGLLRLSRKTIRNRAISRNGERYSVNGTRMSGDVDTSLGNSLINYYIIMEVIHRLGIDGDAIVNGDDFIIFTNSPIPTEPAKLLFRHYNMDTKLVASTDNIHHVEFCRTKLFYHPDDHPTMAFDYNRLINIYGASYKLLPHKKYLLYLEAVQHANYCINLNSPVHRQWRALPKLEDKLKKYLPQNVVLELSKQSTNRVYKWDYLTPSFVEAFPNYRITSPKIILYKPPPPQKHIIINHNIKEISQL